MPGATREPSEKWVAEAADLLNGTIDVPPFDLSLDGERPAMPNVELGPLCEIIFAKGPVFPAFDLFELGLPHYGAQN